MSKAPVFLLAFLVFVVGRWLSKRIGKSVENLLNKAPNADPALSRFFASIVKFVILFAAIMGALAVIGVNTSGISGMVLGFSVALAFILKDALADVAAGVMLMVFRPYNVGDEVEIGGTKGVVQSIEILATRMKTRDNIEIIVGNGKAWGGVIRHYNAMGQRRLDKVFGISYAADINLAIKVLTETAAKDPRVYQDPAPWAKVVKLNDSSVDIELRIWCDYNDHRAIKTDISQPVKAAFDAASIGIPYPHEVVIKQTVKNSKTRDRIKRLTALRNT
ncbi:MAG: mechanosensitive ion channel family protein [Xanthomonadales bacterium]|nr:mechanosensitive ion channel family protein [Xanthomonadales bacterium]